MTAQHPVRVSRRTVVAGLVATPVATALLSSCSLAPAVRAASLAEVPDADARRRWSALLVERELAALLTATAAAHPELGGPLTGFADHHVEHVTTLRAEGPFPRLADPDAETPAADVPSTAADALAAVLAAEEAAVEAHLSSCESCEGPRLATVLASTAASAAGIAALVAAL